MYSCKNKINKRKRIFILRDIMETQEQEQEHQILTINKKGVCLKKINNDFLEITHSIEHNRIKLDTFMDFHFFKLLNEVNQDIYKVIEWNVIDKNTINLVILVKHFFEDLGISQKYLNLKINKVEERSRTTFTISTYSNKHPTNIAPQIENIIIKNMSIELKYCTQNKLSLHSIIQLDINTYIPPFVDKLIGTLVCKLFIRIKQFIENAMV